MIGRSVAGCRYSARRFCAFVVVLVWIVGNSAPAGARAAEIRATDAQRVYNVIGHAEILDDPAGNLDIDDVARTSAFRPATSAQPADDGIRWYRFRLSLPASTAEQWYLATTYGCDSANLYVPTGAAYALRPFGYQVPLSRRPAPTSIPATDVSRLGHQTLLVRLQCDRAPQALDLVSRSYLEASTHVELTRLLDSGLIALTVLAFGLAAITRTPALAFAGMSGVIAGFGVNTIFISLLAPSLTLPPQWLTFNVISALWAISQWFYYDRFLELREHRPRLRRMLLCALAVSAIGNFAWVFTPLAWQNSFVGGVVGLIIWDAIIIAATPVAVIVAVRGNRSAWYAVAGGALLLFGGVIQSVADALNLPALVADIAASFPWTPDLMLLILGVGDRLRETTLERQRALEANDAMQTLLLREQRERIEDSERRSAAFARFVPREFLDQLGKAEIVDVQLGDHVEREMAVLFTDIRGFTTLAERFSPDETFAFLNTYLARVGPLVRAHGGFIDKYVGDAIVGLFPGRPDDALNAAIALQSEVRRFNEDRARRGDEPIAVGVGVNFGRLMLGTIGEAQRVETTVIADSVNVASRLQDLTKVYGVSIIVSASAVDALTERQKYCLRPLGDLNLRGHRAAQSAFELFDGDRDDIVLHKRRTLGQFEAGLAAYAEAHYERSRDLFDQIASEHPLDRAAAYLRDRSRSLSGASATNSEA